MFVDQVPREQASDDVLALYEQLSPDSYMALLDIGPEGANGLRIVPTSHEGTGLPRLAHGEAFNRITERLVRLSAPWGTELLRDPGGITVPLGET